MTDVNNPWVAFWQRHTGTHPRPSQETIQARRADLNTQLQELEQIRKAGNYEKFEEGMKAVRAAETELQDHCPHPSSSVRQLYDHGGSDLYCKDCGCS